MRKWHLSYISLLRYWRRGHLGSKTLENKQFEGHDYKLVKKYHDYCNAIRQIVVSSPRLSYYPLFQIQRIMEERLPHYNPIVPKDDTKIGFGVILGNHCAPEADTVVSDILASAVSYTSMRTCWCHNLIRSLERREDENET